MKKLIALLLFAGLVSAPVWAADRVTAVLTMTNIPSATQTLVVNGDTRTWIGTVTLPGSQVATNASAAGSMTNLWRHIVASGFSGPVLPQWYSTNAIWLAGAVGQSMSVSASGWASISYSTQVVSQATDLRVPATVETAAVRTQIWTQATAALGAYSQSPVSQVSAFAGELVGLTNSQTIGGAKSMTNLTGIWAGVISNSTLRLANVNATNYGILFGGAGGVWLTLGADGKPGLFSDSSGTPGAASTYTPGSGGLLSAGIADNRYGRLASPNAWTATNSFSQITNTAIVGSSLDYAPSISGTVGALTNGWYASPVASNLVAVGAAFYAQNGTDNTTLQIGRTATATGGSSAAVGYGASATKTESVSLGAGALATNSYSAAIGRAAQTTADSQIRVGTASESVSIPGGLAVSGNLVVGRDWGGAPAGLAGGILLTNGTAASADPGAGAAVWAAGGELEYRTSMSSEGSGGPNRVHNRGAVVVGSGGDFAVTGTSYARVDFGGQDPELLLPSAGTYLIWSEVAIREDGVQANDDWSVKLYNASDAADVANTVRSLGGLPVSEAGQLRIQTILTVTAGKTIQLYARNASGARGQVAAAETVIGYVRLY